MNVTFPTPEAPLAPPVPAYVPRTVFDNATYLGKPVWAATLDGVVFPLVDPSRYERRQGPHTAAITHLAARWIVTLRSVLPSGRVEVSGRWLFPKDGKQASTPKDADDAFATATKYLNYFSKEMPE